MILYQVLFCFKINLEETSTSIPVYDMMLLKASHCSEVTPTPTPFPSQILNIGYTKLTYRKLKSWRTSRMFLYYK